MSEFRRKPVPDSTSKNVAYSGITAIEYSNYDESSSQDIYQSHRHQYNNAESKMNELISTPPQRRPNVLRFWGWEMLSTFTCVAILVAITAVLSRFHRKKLPDWPLHINLNAAVAILADVLKAALLLIAGAIISQSKWHWFSRQPRPLSQLQRFEEASRSILGSASLLFTAASHIPTLLATILTILAIAVGPFTQQAVQTTSCLKDAPDQVADIPVAQYFGKPPLVASTELAPDLYGSIINGLVNPQGNDSRIPVVCPTGNCTFPADSAGITHRSVGLCNMCLDTTPLIQTSVNDRGVVVFRLPKALPEGIQVSNEGGVAAATVGWIDKWAASLLVDQETRQAFGHSVVNLTIMTMTKNRKITLEKPKYNITHPQDVYAPIALTCGFYACLQNYFAQVNDGILSEKIVSTVAASGISYAESSGGIAQSGYPSFSRGNYTILNNTCLIDDQIYTRKNISAVQKKPGREFAEWSKDGKNETVPMECLYLMSEDYGGQLGAGIGMYFNGSCSGVNSTDQFGPISCSQIVSDSSDTATAFSTTWWLIPFYQNGEATIGALKTAMEDLAAVVTNKVRTAGSSVSDLDQRQYVAGIAQRSTVCTKFEWRWLLFPVILTITAVVLLIWDIVASQRDHTRPVWKNSLLPLLFYGHGIQSKQPQSAATVNELDMRAKKTMVMFQYGDDAGFVQQPGTGSDSQIRQYEL